MNEEQKEQLGVLIDELDSSCHTLQLNMPPAMHVDSLRRILPEKVEALKRLFIEITGENPWE